MPNVLDNAIEIGKRLQETSEFPSGTEKPLDLIYHVIMADKFSVIKLQTALLDFLFEPFIMVNVLLHKLLHHLFGLLTVISGYAV